jgi:general secretion pathway protein J
VRMRTQRDGFSLVELLVAVVLLAIMGALTYESLTQASAAKEESEEALDRMHAIRAALGRLVRDLSMAFLSKHKDPAMGDKPRTLFRGDRDKVLFTALSHQRLFRDAKESDQCEITYWVRRSAQTRGLALWRRESRRIDDKPEQGGPSLVILDDISRLELRYWEGKDCTDDCWKDRWDTTQLDGQPMRLPQRVRIRLEAKDEFGTMVKYETQAQLWMQEPFNF